MKAKTESMVYRPGQYEKKRMTAAQWANAHIQKWSDNKSAEPKKEASTEMPPTICFSRKIGVGALEIADILTQMIDYRVIDREILDHMMEKTRVTEKTISFFDERYPGRMSELLALLTAEKSFIKSDYARQLTKSAIALSNLEPTLFVGRGIHLILPRERVLAVRFICSQEFRIERLATKFGIAHQQAADRLKEIDKEQREYFKRVYQKKDAVSYEFDLVINRDHLRDAQAAARLVACACSEKFKN